MRGAGGACGIPAAGGCAFGAGGRRAGEIDACAGPGRRIGQTPAVDGSWIAVPRYDGVPSRMILAWRARSLGLSSRRMGGTGRAARGGAPAPCRPAALESGATRGGARPAGRRPVSRRGQDRARQDRSAPDNTAARRAARRTLLPLMSRMPAGRRPTGCARLAPRLGFPPAARRRMGAGFARGVSRGAPLAARPSGVLQGLVLRPPAPYLFLVDTLGDHVDFVLHCGGAGRHRARR